MRREYILASVWLIDPYITRIARFLTMHHTATSWKRVDLPAPGGQFSTKNSLSSDSRYFTMLYAASTCQGLGTRPRYTLRK